MASQGARQPILERSFLHWTPCRPCASSPYLSFSIRFIPCLGRSRLWAWTSLDEGVNPSAVRDLAAYLFRTYIRLVSQAKRKETMLAESLKAEADSQISQRDLARAEAAVLLDEIMRACDRLTREVAFRRLEGLSWKEIGERYGLSGHAAEARFSKALDRARKRLKIQNRER